MATIYSSDSEKTLSDFLAEIMDVNSQVVIPDLQRPYIWNPDEVLLLIDSIFKKWPFGSLLCWKVKISSENSDFIPYRAFWEEVVRGVPSKESKQMSVDKSSSSFLMILDGQQRMQSLLLALGGDSWGFTLTDRDWKKHLEKKDESIDPIHWSTGCLCLDLDYFINEYERCNKKIASIEVGKCVAWVITDEKTGTSSHTKNQVLPLSSIEKGKYIRFSKLWNAAKPVGLMPSDYLSIIYEVYESVEKEKIDFFTKPLSEFMTIIADVKDSTRITRLIVKDFNSSGISEKKLYNNAIVNIFARLNSAGRALTRQEITLAWLKTGWREASFGETNPLMKNCADALEDLLSELNDRNENSGGLLMTMDNLVDILSMFWCILTKDGTKNDDILLKDKDLTDGDIIKNIGKTTYENWNFIKQALFECKDSFENRKLNECFSRSFNAFNVLCGWKFVALICSSKIQGRVRETECRFDPQINSSFDAFIDRWFFCTYLSGTWSMSNSYSQYVGNLCSLYNSVKNSYNPIKTEDELKDILLKWISALENTSMIRIEELKAYNRREVSGYKNVLWLWNRLESVRWKEVQKPMKRNRAQPKLEVDHAVPVAIWERKIEVDYPYDFSKDKITGIENVFNLSGIDFTRSKLVSWINNIGNCSLLLRSHNRSKNDEQFGDFLKSIYSELQISDFKESLKLTNAMLNPIEINLEEIVESLNKRTEIIKEDLKDFIKGQKVRMDIIDQ